MKTPEIVKSSRHSKIAGNFSEALLLYWLSKHGFECASVDHTGIDLIANNPHNGDRMGISVKSRTRSPGTESGHINIRRADFAKVDKACHGFGCVPYFAIVADAAEMIRVFVLPMSRLKELFPRGEKVCCWQMSKKYVDAYYADPDIKVFELKTNTHAWWHGEP